MLTLLSAGCATWTFRATREARFVNLDAERLHVAYGRERRTETLPNGLVCTFEGKVRIRLPDGRRIVLYQAIATSGMRYVSANKRFAFHEKGPFCAVYQDGQPIFEGVYSRDP